MPEGRHGNPPLLGPHVVGQRVVVRRLVRGETGPTGGPAMTDVLGVCESWDDGVVVVRREQGDLVTIETADIVSGKPVPPRPTRHRHLDPVEADRLALPGWQPVESEPLGEWVLRASGGFSSRGNSVLALGDPGLPLPEAVEHVGRVVPDARAPASRPRPPRQRGGGRLRRRRLGELRPDAADAGRGVPGAAPARPGQRRRGGAAQQSRRRLAGQRRTRRPVRRPGQAGPRDRRGHAGDGAGRRRHGARPRPGCLSRRLGRGLLPVDPCRRASYGPGQRGAPLAPGVGSERGATTTYLQVVLSNVAAQELYEAHGYEVHHRYDYLVSPDR